MDNLSYWLIWVAGIVVVSIVIGAIRAVLREEHHEQTKHKLEVAEMEQRIRALTGSPATDEVLRQQKLKAQVDYDRCLKSKREWLGQILHGRNFEQLSEEEQEQYRADEMMWSDRIRRAREELSKHL